MFGTTKGIAKNQCKMLGCPRSWFQVSAEAACKLVTDGKDKIEGPRPSGSAIGMSMVLGEALAREAWEACSRMALV